MSKEDPMRIRVVGVGGVGKSALTIQFMRGEFIKDYVPTIEESYSKEMVVDGDTKYLDILDTAGQEEYSALRDTYMKGGEGFVLVYSITERSSLDELDEFYNQILMVKNKEQVPMVMCGNKCDLEEEREVDQNEAKSVSSNMRIPHFETSAKTRANVEDAFEDLVRQIENERSKDTKKPNSELNEKESEKEKKKCCTIM